MPVDFAARRARVADQCGALQVDAFLITDVRNVAYLTGFGGDSSHLLLAPGRTLFVSDYRYERQFREECPGLDGYFRRPGESLPQATAKALKDFGDLAFEAGSMTVALHDQLADLAETVAFRPTNGVVEALRAIKDEHEIAALRNAVRIQEEAFLALRGSLRDDDTEKRIADRLDNLMRNAGAESAAFPPIVATGDRAGLPHAIPGAARFDSASFTLVDWGACAAGHHGDCTRMVVRGRIEDQLRKIYGIVHAAQAKALAALRPGARAADVDGLVRQHMEEHGYGAAFGHGLGHGVGRQIHEAPFMRPESEEVFAAGMVVTVEPGLYLEGWGGVRVEDMALITEAGCERLTTLSSRLEDAVL